MLSKFRSVKTGIKNLIKWFPIIWKDRDWDYYFIYAILHKKLNNMEKFYSSDKAWASDSKDVAEQIKEAKVLCKRLMDEDYINIVDKKKEEDKNKLFDIINKNINNWWD